MSRSESRSEGERLEELARLLSEENECENQNQVAFSTAVTSIFDVKCPEMEIYLSLLEHPESTPTELSEVVDRGRGSVNRRLLGLQEKNLVTRKARIDNKSGTEYEYTAAPLDETVDWMEEEFDEWSAEVSRQLATFREEWPECDRERAESS